MKLIIIRKQEEKVAVLHNPFQDVVIAIQLISKINFWNEKDRLIKQGIDKFSSEMM